MSPAVTHRQSSSGRRKLRAYLASSDGVIAIAIIFFRS